MILYSQPVLGPKGTEVLGKRVDKLLQITDAIQEMVCPVLFCFVLELGIEPRAPHILGKCSSAELYLQLENLFLIQIIKDLLLTLKKDFNKALKKGKLVR